MIQQQWTLMSVPDWLEVTFDFLRLLWILGTRECHWYSLHDKWKFAFLTWLLNGCNESTLEKFVRLTLTNKTPPWRVKGKSILSSKPFWIRFLTRIFLFRRCSTVLLTLPWTRLTMLELQTWMLYRCSDAPSQKSNFVKKD